MTSCSGAKTLNDRAPVSRANRRLAARLCYQSQDSRQTLGEGLEEYYEANVGKVVRPSELPARSYRLFRNHDICHVIFGLGTSLDDEALADTRTLVSSDVGFHRYLAYLTEDRQAQALFKELGYAKSAWVSVLATPRMLRAVVEACRMPKPWPWDAPDSFQTRTLSELRHEFGIRII